MHVEILQKSLGKVDSRKNISGNLITVFNNAGLNDKEQFKTMKKKQKLRTLSDSLNGPYESDNQEQLRGNNNQSFTQGDSMILKVN